MLKAAWLGHWKAPWGLDRGRRWGDPLWALPALAQAWQRSPPFAGNQAFGRAIADYRSQLIVGGVEMG